MKFCQKCGKEIMDEAVVCPNCGCKDYSSDTGSIGWAILGFLIPLVGLILYLIWTDTKPNNAKKAGGGALIGFIVNVGFSIIYGAVIGSIIGSLY